MFMIGVMTEKMYNAIWVERMSTLVGLWEKRVKDQKLFGVVWPAWMRAWDRKKRDKFEQLCESLCD